MNEKRMVLALDDQDTARIVEALVATGLPVDHIHLPVSELTSRLRDAGVNFDLVDVQLAEPCVCGRKEKCCRLVGGNCGTCRHQHGTYDGVVGWVGNPEDVP